VYVNKISAEAAKARAAARAGPAPRPRKAGFELKGVLSAASANQIAELNDYASRAPKVVVDVQGAAPGVRLHAAFFDVVKAIQLAGKRVILTNLNELNADFSKRSVSTATRSWCAASPRELRCEIPGKNRGFPLVWLEGQTLESPLPM